MKRYSAWQESNKSLTDYLEIGDTVDEAFASYFLEIVFPAYFTSNVIQMGEPADHLNGYPRYLTIAKKNGKWIYMGPRKLRDSAIFGLIVP